MPMVITNLRLRAQILIKIIGQVGNIIQRQNLLQIQIGKYAIDSSGNVLWDKTTWTQTVGNFELAFNQDLDGDGVKDIDVSSFTDEPLIPLGGN